MAVETYNHSYKEVVDLIVQCLDYRKEDGFNTLIVKKLQLLRNKVADEVIAEVVKNEGWKIKNKKFDTEAGKISYFFAILNNNISYYNRKHEEKKSFNEKMKLQNENNFVDEEIANIANNKTTKNNVYVNFTRYNYEKQLL